MRVFFLLAFMLAFAVANSVTLFTACPGFTSQSSVVLTAKMVINGVTGCGQAFNLTVTDPIGNVTQNSGTCVTSTGVTTFTIKTPLGGAYTAVTSNFTNPAPSWFKVDTCNFNSLKKNKVSIPDSNYLSMFLVFVLVGFVYYRKKN